MATIDELLVQWREVHEELCRAYTHAGHARWLEDHLDRLITVYRELNRERIAEGRGPIQPEDCVVTECPDKYYEKIVYQVALHGVILAELALQIGNGWEKEPLSSGWNIIPLAPMALHEDECGAIGPRVDTVVLLDWVRSMTAQETIDALRDEACRLCVARLDRCAALGAKAWLSLADRTSDSHFGNAPLPQV